MAPTGNQAATEKTNGALDWWEELAYSPNQSIPNFDAQHTKQRCISEQEFSLHAEVRCAMNQRKKLEQLCHYITRPAIANERLKLNDAGDVVLQLKSPYREGITHIVMTPLGGTTQWRESMEIRHAAKKYL